jgi:23S rRNA pseudouridine1911/1915/1917 synthase
VAEYHVVPLERAGIELDELVCLLLPGVSKGFVRAQIRLGNILVDGQPANVTQRLRVDQVLVLDIDEEELPDMPVAPDLEIAVLYEDADLLVVDKPAGLAVEPERWHKHLGSLSGAVLRLALDREDADDANGDGEGFRPRIVHRLDKDTTGCVIVAKHIEAERVLRDAFANPELGGIRKRYLALVEGEHPLGDGEHELIELPLRPDDKKSGRMIVATSGGKPSRTRIEVAQRFRGYTLLACEPKTGRTHQIRVHLAAVGFPLVVDPAYGRRDALLLSEVKAGYRPKRGRVERPLIDRLTLHAASVVFRSPSDPAREIFVESPLPADLARTFKQLAKVRASRRRADPGLREDR